MCASLKFLNSVVFSLLLGISLQSLAQVSESRSGEDLQLGYERKVTRAHFSLGSEFINMASKSSSVMGFGPRAGFEYGIDEKWSLGAGFTFCFQATGKPGSFFYSGINGVVHYAIQGSSVKITDQLSRKDGTSIYSSKPSAKRRSTLLIGLEQLLLNGVANIYPAVGPTIGGSFGFGIWGKEAELSIRYSSLIANDNPLTMIAVGAQMNLDFLN